MSKQPPKKPPVRVGVPIPAWLWQVMQKKAAQSLTPSNFTTTPSGLSVPRTALPIPVFSRIPDEDIYPEPPVEPFEVNMVEPLVGWKTWEFDSEVMFQLNTRDKHWPYDQPLVAECGGIYGAASDNPRHRNEVAPVENCTCGIYAADSRDEASRYNGWDENATHAILGEVYGWGQYIRGDSGWRVQYAYPKSFYLRDNQAHFVEHLRKYHVPIFVMQPSLIYNPEEDGYEYRRAEAEGDFGASQDSTPVEEDGQNADEGDYPF